MERKRRSDRRRGGFTLTELMLVLVIISIVAGTGVVALMKTRQVMFAQAADGKIKSYKTPLGLYAQAIGEYPTTEEGLEALHEAPSGLSDPDLWKGPYIEESPELDPWGMAYQYECPGTNNPDSYDLYSMGPDKTPGTDDDVTNWSDK